MLYELAHKDTAVKHRHMQPVYTKLKKGTIM